MVERDEKELRALGTPPLVEAMWELRFVPGTEGVADVLPGMFFSKLRGTQWEIRALPMANVPRELRMQDANLRYKAHHQLTAGPRRIQLGEDVITHSYVVGYPGWQAFAAETAELIGILRDTKLVEKLERTSLRYINLLVPPKGEGQLSQLNVSFRLMGSPANESGLHFRTELKSDDLLSIVQLRTGAMVRELGDDVGVLLDIDTIHQVNSDGFWETSEQDLKRIHARLKQTFLGVLTEDALERLEPQWGTP